jgi:hypothetical protein
MWTPEMDTMLPLMGAPGVPVDARASLQHTPQALQEAEELLHEALGTALVKFHYSKRGSWHWAASIKLPGSMEERRSLVLRLYMVRCTLLHRYCA